MAGKNDEALPDVDHIDSISKYLLENTTCRPSVGIICGSGLSGLSSCLTDTTVFDYRDIPDFPDTTVPGHTGELVFGKYMGTQVVCMRGRFHFYEGHPMTRVALPSRVFARLGVKVLVVTNAAGGLNPSFNVGDVMIIQDHLNMPGLGGLNPLIGNNDSRFGPRFPPMGGAYDVELQELAALAGAEVGLSSALRTGIYTFVSGPFYETPVEAAFLRSLGGDSVGMSTIPEVVAARHSGLRVLGLSLVTNQVVMRGPRGNKTPPSHKEVLEAVQSRTDDICAMVKQLIPRLGAAAEGEATAAAAHYDPSTHVALAAVVNRTDADMAAYDAAIAPAPAPAPAPAAAPSKTAEYVGVAAVAAAVGALVAVAVLKAL